MLRTNICNRLVITGTRGFSNSPASGSRLPDRRFRSHALGSAPSHGGRRVIFHVCAGSPQAASPAWC